MLCKYLCALHHDDDFVRQDLVMLDCECLELLYYHMLCGCGVQYAERITGVRCLQARRASRCRKRKQGRLWWVMLGEDRFGTYREGQRQREGLCWVVVGQAGKVSKEGYTEVRPCSW